MTGPNSVNPSDTDPEERPDPLLGEDTGDSTAEDSPGDVKDTADKQADSEKSKLKLKPILTPLSPHLKKPHPPRDPELEENRPKMEIPRAVPVDPEPELAPHERPPGADADSTTNENGPAEANGPGPEAVVPQEQPQQDSTESQPEDAATEEEPEVEELVTAPRKRPNLVLLVALPVVLLAAIAYLVNFLFDPFGLNEDPIQSLEPTQVRQRRAAPGTEAIPENMAPVVLSMELEKMTPAQFIERLQQINISRSNNPEGVYIGSVFFKAGDFINPALGLQLARIVTDPDGTSIEISGEDGSLYSVPLP